MPFIATFEVEMLRNVTVSDNRMYDTVSIFQELTVWFVSPNHGLFEDGLYYGNTVIR